jgi:hypothetical protein
MPRVSDASVNLLDRMVYCTRPTPRFARSLLQFRNKCFCTFPLAVFGSSSCPSSPRNHTHLGAFWAKSLIGKTMEEHIECTHLWVHRSAYDLSYLIPRERLTSGGIPHYPRPDDFAINVVRHRDYSRFENGRCSGQDIFDLHREKVLQGRVSVDERVQGRDGVAYLSTAYDDVLSNC